MPYDRHEAVAYAHQWAYGRNPAYYDFSRLGGDCTNFISQCLYAGCHVMNTARDIGWYYHSLANRAAAWSATAFLYRFLTANQGTGPYGWETSFDDAQPGDIIQLSFSAGVFSHSLFVVNTDPEILVTTHTDDSDNRPLTTYQYQLARVIHIEGART